jgi:transposase-like protein
VTGDFERQMDVSIPAKRHPVEEIVAKLRDHERLPGQDLTIRQACKKLGISDQTFYRWRIRYRSNSLAALLQRTARSQPSPRPELTRPRTWAA